MVEFLSFLYKEFAVGSLNLSIMDIIFASLLLIAGIFLGKIVGFVLKKIAKRAEVEKAVKHSFINLFITVIKWSIYILFINLALEQLKIPQLTSWLTSILVVIPALVGSLLLIVTGFAIAVYLRDLIEESNILYCKVLSIIIFYFVLYVFCIFALKTALISLDKNIVNIILIILTGISFAGVAYWHSRQR